MRTQPKSLNRKIKADWRIIHDKITWVRWSAHHWYWQGVMNLAVSITSYVWSFWSSRWCRFFSVSTINGRFSATYLYIDRMAGLIKVVWTKGEAIESKMLSRSRWKGTTRKWKVVTSTSVTLLEYDDVANDQRKVVYELRDELMSSDDINWDDRTQPWRCTGVSYWWIHRSSVSWRYHANGSLQVYQNRRRTTSI